jgi:GAF domain-containing protein
VTRGDHAAEDALAALDRLSHALAGNASLPDVGLLLWMLLREVAPSEAMAIFLPDEAHAHVVIRYAAGVHAAALEGIARPTGSGIAEWSAVSALAARNGDPSLDLGLRGSAAPALRSCLALPLIEDEAVVAVLVLYSTDADRYSAGDLRTLETLSPRLARALVDAVIADEDSRVPVRATRTLRLVHST